MIEGAGTVFGVEPRYQICHAGERGQTTAPALIAVAGAELESGSKRPGRVLTPVQQMDDGFRQNEWEVLFEAFPYAHPLVGHEVVPAGHVDPDLVASYFD